MDSGSGPQERRSRPPAPRSLLRKAGQLSVISILCHWERQAERLLGGVAGKKIGILGLTFKPNTDDVREAPAVAVARELIDRGASVRGYDPVANEVATKLAPEVELVDDPYDLAEGCDALVVVTEWNEFKHLDLDRIRKLMNQPVLVDGRNIYDPVRMKALGFYYRGVGRGYGDGEGDSERR